MKYPKVLDRAINKKETFLAIILIFVSCICSLFLCEAIVRLFFPQHLYSFEQGLFAESHEFGYRLTPNIEGRHSQPEYTYLIKANSFGFRGKEPNFAAEYCVLVMGDSFGMGQGVPEGRNLCELAQQYFVRQNLDIDIFNTSLSGYSGVNQVQVLKKFIESYDPDLAVLLFYWNDIGPTKSLFIQNGFLVLRKKDCFTARLREWLNNHSYLFCLVKKTYYLLFCRTSSFQMRAFSEADIAIAFNHILNMKKICDKNGTNFVVILLPLYGIYEWPEEFQDSKELFVSKLKTETILYEDWEKRLPVKDREKLVFASGLHWNELGHMYFSKHLSRLIIDQKQEIYFSGVKHSQQLTLKTQK